MNVKIIMQKQTLQILYDMSLLFVRDLDSTYNLVYQIKTLKIYFYIMKFL